MPLLIHVIANLNPAIVYAIYPLQVWATMNVMYLHPNDTLSVGCGMAGLAISTIEVCMILTVLRNTVPCKTFLSCIDMSREIPIFFASIMAMVLGLLQYYNANFETDLAYQSSICVLNLLQDGYFTFNPKYWLPEASKWFLAIYSFLLLCNAWNLGLIIQKKRYLYCSSTFGFSRITKVMW